MTEERVTVVVPVGPFAVYKRWLRQCLESVRAQTYPIDEVLIVDDMAGITLEDIGEFADEMYQREGIRARTTLIKHGAPVGRIWWSPWRLGDVGAFNCGVGLARNELVFLLSCDDTLEPNCLEMCVAEWEKHDRRDAFYYVGAHKIGCEGETIGEDQTQPFGNAMITKELWRMTGGFVAGAANGDWVFLQLLGTHFPDRCFPVANARPLYNARVHDESITNTKGSASLRWPTEWGRVS